MSTTAPVIEIDALRSRFHGALLKPDDEGYEEARRIWNGAIDRRPALIARCTGGDDVVEAVHFARERQLRVSVRGGGHAVAGHAVCDDGLMIDLSLMKSIRVDREKRVVRAAGGLLWRELDQATQSHGLATTGGVISHTGVAGLTLGGGLGNLMRKHGLTVDNLLAVDLVTADGERLRVDDETEPELMWGLRGGGGNFGVAVGFEFQLHPVGPLVLGGPIFWPFEQAPRVLRFVRDFAPEAPDELGITIAMLKAPPSPFLPPNEFGKPALALIPVWFGDLEAGERAIAQLRQIAPPIADVVRVVPYLFIQSMLDGGAPHGRHYYWRSHRLPTFSDAAIEILVESMASMTSPFSQINAWATGGAVNRVASSATAVGEREIGFHVGINAGWAPSDLDGQRHLEWVRRVWDALRPYSSGVYVNFLSDEGKVGIEAAYGARVRRLTALKDRCDPTNLFRLNANIPPTGWTG